MEDTNIQAQGKKLLSSKEILQRARKFYKDNFNKLWPLYILGGLGGMSFSGGSHGSGGGSSTGSASSSSFNFFSIFPLWAWILIGVVLIAISIFLFISKISLLKGISDTNKGQFVGVKDSYKKGFGLFWSFILISIMVSWSVLGASVLFIIPGIILSVYLSFTIYELIDKQKKGFQALLGSWALIKGYWWKFVGRSIMIGLRIFLIGLIYSLAILIPMLILVIPGMVFHITALLVAGVSLGAIAFFCLFFVFLTPLSMIAMFELYYSFCDVRASDKVVDEALNKKRKRKLVICMWLAPIVIVVSLILATILISLGQHS